MSTYLSIVPEVSRSGFSVEGRQFTQEHLAEAFAQSLASQYARKVSVLKWTNKCKYHPAGWYWRSDFRPC